MNLAVIIIDFGDMQRTMKYIKDFQKAIEEKHDVKFIIVENKMSYDGESVLQDELNYSVDSAFFDEKQIYKFQVNENECVYIKANENLGFARGNNLGAEVARRVYHAEYYCFSNNDIRFYNKLCLDTVEKTFQTLTDVAVIGPHVVDLDNVEQSPCKKKTIFQLMFLWYYNIMLNNCFIRRCGHVEKMEQSGSCYWVSGCFMFVDSHKFHEIDGFDANTFLYGEEMILAERFQKKGYTMYYDHTNSICHETSQSVNASFERIQSIIFEFESKYYYCKEYRNTPKIVLQLTKINFAIFKVLYRIECKIIKLKNRKRST